MEVHFHCQFCNFHEITISLTEAELVEVLRSYKFLHAVLVRSSRSGSWFILSSLRFIQYFKVLYAVWWDALMLPRVESTKHILSYPALTSLLLLLLYSYVIKTVSDLLELTIYKLNSWNFFSKNLPVRLDIHNFIILIILQQSVYQYLCSMLPNTKKLFEYSVI